MSDPRKAALVRLIKMRRELEDAINVLSGDPEHRQFVKKYEAGFTVAVREVRNYDVEPMTPDEVAEKYALDTSAIEGEVPEWFAERFGDTHDLH